MGFFSTVVRSELFAVSKPGVLYPYAHRRTGLTGHRGDRTKKILRM